MSESSKANEQNLGLSDHNKAPQEGVETEEDLLDNEVYEYITYEPGFEDFFNALDDDHLRLAFRRACEAWYQYREDLGSELIRAVKDLKLDVRYVFANPSYILPALAIVEAMTTEKKRAQLIEIGKQLRKVIGELEGLERIIDVADGKIPAAKR